MHVEYTLRFLGRGSVGDGTAAKKKGSEALPRCRWVKENSCAGSGFPSSPTATTLSLLPFPADGSYRLFEQQ